MVLGCKMATLLSSDGDSSTIKRFGLDGVSWANTMQVL
jgi:hypothetical protein